jgi:copper chaperone CopZ
MKTITIEVPAMFGDHHVLEVRRILLEMPGVKDVYASSSFRVVEISFDPDTSSADELHKVLEDAGYLGEMVFPVETGEAAHLKKNGKPFFRHTAVYENTQKVVSFAQQLPYSGRPLWPCPGIGVVRVEE